MNEHHDISGPILIFIRGLPGSGKSFLAAKLQAELGKHRVAMLDPDATDYTSEAYLKHSKTLTAEGVDKKLHPYRFLRAQAYDGITSGKIIIWNQPFTNLEIFNKMVARLQTHASEHNLPTVPIVVVEVEINPDSAKERIEKRKQAGGHGPSDTTFTRFIRDYTSFSQYGYKTVSVSGEDNAEKSILLIMDALKKI